jgi:hypothetical protein
VLINVSRLHEVAIVLASFHLSGSGVNLVTNRRFYPRGGLWDSVDETTPIN